MEELLVKEEEKKLEKMLKKLDDSEKNNLEFEN